MPATTPPVLPLLSSVLVIFFATAGQAAAAGPTDDAAIVHAEFIYDDDAPTPQCHASTIVETPAGLVAAWFGGKHEKNPDVGIWVSRHIENRWLAPIEVANGVQYTQVDGTVHRHPTWNPVLFQYPGGPLLLFYKCGPSPSTWWGMLMRSTDNGATWSEPVRLPEHIDGPVRNKPILLKDGTLLCGSSTEFDGWRLHFELTADHGQTWTRTPAIHDGKTIGAIQPSLLQQADGRILALCRNEDSNGRVVTTTSPDSGRTWTAPQLIGLPNPNSGIDAVALTDGRIALVYNHTVRSGPSPRGREMLNLAISRDGVTWQAAVRLENEAKAEFSYPAVIQTADGMIHTVYTWKRTRVRHVVIDPAKLTLTPLTESGGWPGLPAAE